MSISAHLLVTEYHSNELYECIYYKSYSSIEDTINELLKRLDEELEERLRSAKVIVSGSVISTYRSELTEGLPGIQEGVQWHHAEICVESVEKGHPPADLRILLPKGGDHEFGLIPNYSSGQKGVWLLRPGPSDQDQGQRGGLTDSEKNGENLIAEDPGDFHAIYALPRIQALLWRINE
jgi:hypothetical protein